MALRRRSTTVLAGPSAAERLYLAMSSGFKEAHHVEFRKDHRVWGRQGAGIQKDAVHPVRHGLEALLKEFPNGIINKHDLIQGMIRFDDDCGCSLSGASGQEQAAWAVKEAQALKAILSHMRKMAGQSKDFSRQPAWLLPLLQTLGPHLGQLEPSSPGGSSRADTQGGEAATAAGGLSEVKECPTKGGAPKQESPTKHSLKALFCLCAGWSPPPVHLPVEGRRRRTRKWSFSKGQPRNLDKWKAMFLCDLDNNTIVKKSLGLTLKPEPTLEEEEESNQEAPSSSTALQGRTPAKEEHQTPKGKKVSLGPSQRNLCLHPPLWFGGAGQ
jgi:hypothetical protein